VPEFRLRTPHCIGIVIVIYSGSRFGVVFAEYLIDSVIVEMYKG